ncbi:uncharacterized protein K452DRAFT_226973 [Aplosporella prunicola CBS 121167]|uniref:Aminoglycoside phosphotransferase domain-containing protein n=1 Tax=Aplosporella prunicola CBS 121167 TaxID=1176127 RepID=A0A6A6BGG3_9PEZI|nr:uncharacterized protein K452DRAFT_226973 [Aplosporella prunicola CBS 121167]KAF2142678.1 hypothetical protein K452DRAFT_226973 [Aplosporella prunicola CBS 121167]
MAYIAQNLGEEQIRVPRVYRSFVIQSESYLVMQYVDGESLDAIPWMSRPPDQRKDIIKQATDAVLALRTLEAKAPGPVERSGFPTGGFFSDYGANTVFANISEMEQWLDRKLRIYNRHDQALLRGTSWSLSGCFKTLVMCHMDIALRNLKLDRHGRLWFLDWEWAGFYPPEFEIAYLHCIIGEGADLEFFKDLLRGLGSLDRNDVVDKLHQVYYVNNSCFAASHIVGVDC